MAASTENIAKTLIVPPESSERFISFPHYATGEGWFDNGVALAGISRLTAGYRVNHQQARFHFAGYAICGRAEYRGSGEEHRIEGGRFLFLPAGQRQCISTDADFEMCWLLLNPVHRRWNALPSRLNIVDREWRCGERFTSLMEMLHAESQIAGETDDRIVNGYCRLIFAYLEHELTRREYSVEAAQRKERLEKLWQEVQRSLKAPWPVERLARNAGMSVSHFHATVTGYYHTGPQEIVRRLRIDRVKNLLRHSDSKLEEIAELTGFSSAFALSRSFKKQTGMCPREFRLQHSAGPR